MENEFLIRHIDLSQLEADTFGGNASFILSVFWWDSTPLGMRVTLPDELPFSQPQLHQLRTEFIAAQITARCASLGATPTADGLPQSQASLQTVLDKSKIMDCWARMIPAPSSTAGDLSVIICTRDRGAVLSRCLRSILRQESAPAEIIVVDNSLDGSAQKYCQQIAGVSYLRETRPGLSVARNTGVRAATKPLIAFTDDDVELHAHWTSAIVNAFESDKIEAVTGLVLPLSLDTTAQRLFQFDLGGFGSNFVPTVFDHRWAKSAQELGPRVWKLGAGANMAFRRRVLDRVGFFDERLGAGAAGCSEDSELWYRILMAGHAILYEPKAVVFHEHRRDLAGLRRQAMAYMKGHVAALIVQYDNFKHVGNLTRIWRQLPLSFLRTLARAFRKRELALVTICAFQVCGWFAGLHFLLRPRWRRLASARRGRV